jgi:GntR family transcriptional regulator
MSIRPSGIPAYTQLAERLRVSIEKGSFKPGARLPAEQQLMAEEQLSRVTVRAALSLLERDGWVVRKQGIGTFAAYPIDQELSSVRTMPEVLLTLGMIPDVKVLSFGPVEPTPDVQRKLRLRAGEQVLLVRRLYRINRSPVALVYVHLPLALAAHAGILKDGRAPLETTFTILEEKLGVVIKEAHHVITAQIAEEKVARALKIEKGAPILVLNRLTNSVEGQPLEYDICHYHAERYKFSVTVPRRRFTSKGAFVSTS